MRQNPHPDRRIKGRTDDMLILKGSIYSRFKIEKKLMEIPGVGTNFLIVLERKGFNDHMTVRVEVERSFFPETLDSLRT